MEITSSMIFETMALKDNEQHEAFHPFTILADEEWDPSVDADGAPED